jgi:heterodisulfide reductase subunit C
MPIFIILFAIALVTFSFTMSRIVAFFRLTHPAYPVREIGRRLWLTFKTAFLQDKIFRFPFAGFLHAMVFWGFLSIQFINLEMITDGITGLSRSFAGLGVFYGFMSGLADVFAYIVALFVLAFLFRRIVLHVKRLYGRELKPGNHYDAYLALSLILLLMISLMGKNIFWLLSDPDQVYGYYPVSNAVSGIFSGINPVTAETIYRANWWTHILLVFVFANILPYSKHFHIFVSVPNVFLSRLDKLGKMANMKSVQNEVNFMLNPDSVNEQDMPDAPQNKRFGVLDVEDVSWKNYIDSLACTQCGRCTAVCPANITGKKLSPRKLFVDIRNRMNERGPGLIKDKNYSDGKSLRGDYISDEELWACTTCMACAKECPLNIDHPGLILDMRRYLVMEESAAPAALNAMFANIENNGAPWQFSNEDRLNWTD